MKPSAKSVALRGGLALLGGLVLLAAVWMALLSNAAPFVTWDPADPLPDYSAAFDQELKKVGQLSPEEFAERYRSRASYLPKVTWDPTTARFWDRVMGAPAAKGPGGQGAGPAAHGGRAQGPSEESVATPVTDDVRPNEAERALLRQNGFVVSERLGDASPTQLFYRIYARDLPVFVTADAVLHAWHRSYDTILEEVEQSSLAPTLADLLGGMAQQLPAAQRRYGTGVLADSLTDADYFLGVARSLLAGQAVGTYLGQDGRVNETLRACEALRLQELNLFGRERVVDFSQFKPRGHYEKSEPLRRYFRAMTWCGRIDLRVAGQPGQASPRELGTAVVLHDLLRRSGKSEEWQQFDLVLQTFVGRTDSMTFAQLGKLLRQAGVGSPADVNDPAVLAALQAEALAGKYGLQHVRSDYVASDPASPVKAELPRSFTLIGQRFALDSWVTAKVVFDEVIWDGQKVMRRIPTCLDVAFAALGNDQVVPELAARLTDAGGRRFRDGLNYQHNLAAARNVVDGLEPPAWEESLYACWLACLRELSAPTTDARYPEAMRTRAWAMKTLNTQLASWAQLRHDTVLYARQSSTATPICYYPAGYVEPVPGFWARMERMAGRAADLLERTPLPGGEKTTWWRRWLPRGKEKRTRVQFLRDFAGKAAVLRGIAEKELAQQELSGAEARFLRDLVEQQTEPRGCVTLRRYSGWYPSLFYEGGPESSKPDALVADVHTDMPAGLVGDPGCVLHQGVGDVDLLLIAIDSGTDRMVYAGPVLSHYEFEVPGVKRKSDAEWGADLRGGRRPPRPEWTKGYLVPR
jgi:hypothetical protein